MAKYRKVDTKIWNDKKFNELSAFGKLVFLFVLTHPNMTPLGAMRGTIEGLCSELNEVPLKAFREAFQKPFIKYSQKDCFISFPNFLKYNHPESPNVVRSWVGSWDDLPECGLKDELFLHIKQYVKGLSKAFQEAFQEAFPKPLPKTMPNQEQEQEQEEKPLSTPLIKLPDWLDKQIWQDYINHRKQIKSKMTKKAEELAIKKLEKFRDNGNDPVAVIEQTIMQGWKGLFELKDGKQGANNNNLENLGKNLLKSIADQPSIEDLIS